MEHMGFSEKYGNADTPHREKYGKAVADIGLEKIKNLLPWDKEALTEAYQKDEHFSSIPIAEWDRLAGYHENRNTGYITKFSSPLHGWLHDLGINSWSVSECVCILKEAALQIVEEV